MLKLNVMVSNVSGSIDTENSNDILTSLVYTDLLEYSIQNYIELLRRIEYFIFQLKKNLMNFA